MPIRRLLALTDITAMGTATAVLLRYRLRTVRVAVRSTLLAVVVLAAYPALAGSPAIDALAYGGLVAVAGIGALVIGRLPWERMLAHEHGILAMYGWSFLDIVLITVGVMLTGGANSSVFWLYVLTTLFFAASYPTSGQVALLGTTVALYLGVALATEPVIAEMFWRISILCICAFMATFLSRELMDEMQGNAGAREESEHRADLLAAVAQAARSMSTVDASNVLRTVVDAAVEIGFDAAELCMFDEKAGTWTQALHNGLVVADYPVVQPADVGLAGRVREARATVVIDDYSSWEAGMPVVQTAGFRGMVASPVWSAGEMAGVLISGRKAAGVVASEVECLDLLAAQAGAALVVARRYEEHQAFETELRHQATHDHLTGLPNRTLLLDRVQHALDGAARRNGAISVLFLDIDRFKTINDSLGHAAGDQLLWAVAERLCSCVRPGDTLARYGGDEFTVLLEDTNAQAATLVAERILRQLSEPFLLLGREVVVTTSIGIATSEPGYHRADPIRDADLAMYRAKEAGGNRWERFVAAMDAEAIALLDRETDLRRAVAAGEFSLDYQPVVDLASGHITGVEALVRWDHPDKGRISPADFIPLAESTGLIVPLGRWVLEDACRQARVWQDEGLDIRVAINLSAIQFNDPGLLADLDGILSTYGVEPRRIILEVTESVFVNDADRAVATMEGIRRLGVALSLDDFGKGYSSLSYLKRLPLQIVKIDRSFVDGLAASLADQAIVRSVVTLANELGMAVVAEGVETVEQRDQVRRLGCQSMQGYLFSRPVPPEKVAFLARAAAVGRALALDLDLTTVG